MPELSSMPRITMVVPSLNAADTIARTLDSLIAQDYPNMQIFVRDGLSTDGTTDVIQSYADSIDDWVSEKDKGQADALNKGLAAAHETSMMIMR